MVKQRVLESRFQSLEEALNVSRLKWLGPVLRMFTERLCHCTLFPEQIVVEGRVEAASR